MKNIAKLLFQANLLKEIPRSGYHFLGSGKESVAEHTFSTAFVAYVLSKIETGVDALRLISMCLVHDLTETRIGDLNTVQKRYVSSDEDKALADTIEQLPFGGSLSELIREFNEGQTREARLARDADQIAFILDLKTLADIGYSPPQKWLPAVIKRLKTETGKMLAEHIMHTNWDSWWFKKLY
ncbi:MAG: HD domain-containing protein [Deltaproteobacteria bacterium]|nr:MAG: HD domain-containing protein [Deltaproteobacteria bacterium]